MPWTFSVILVNYRECFFTVFTNMKVHMWILKNFCIFSLFSSVTSAALNTIHISYGISYFRHRDSSDIFTYDIARQSIVDKMVREISLEVREKSGKSQGILFSHLCGNPESLSCLNSLSNINKDPSCLQIYYKWFVLWSIKSKSLWLCSFDYIS